MTSLFDYHRLRDKEVKRWQRRPPAEALASEDPKAAKRLATMIRKLVPYPRASMKEFVNVSPTKTDLVVAQLCAAYHEGTDLERAFIRSQINAEQAWVLLTFNEILWLMGFEEVEAKGKSGFCDK